MSNTKVPVPFVKTRGNKSFLVMNQILPVFQATNFVSPNNFNDMVVDITTQEDIVGLKDAQASVAAGLLDAVLGPWHDDSVLTLKSARIDFAAPPNLNAWRVLTANGGGRDAIIKEGKDIQDAWESSGSAWVPKTGKTFALFKAHNTASEPLYKAWKAAENLADKERSMLWVKADAVWDLCVVWYEKATAAFGPETPEGILIRTIPTLYNPNEAPGQLAFTEQFSPAPSQVKLLWGAPRGQHFNIWAKAPGAPEFTKILTNVTQTSWMGEGLQAGLWTFKGEAMNAEGPGEMSAPITVPVQAAQAA